MICGSVLYNVGCGRESGGARIDNIKERSTLKILLTAFRTTPAWIGRAIPFMTLYMSLVTKRVTFVISESRNGGQLVTE